MLQRSPKTRKADVKRQRRHRERLRQHLHCVEPFPVPPDIVGSLIGMGHLTEAAVEDRARLAQAVLAALRAWHEDRRHLLDRHA
jgi:hypothetical protein